MVSQLSAAPLSKDIITSLKGNLGVEVGPPKNNVALCLITIHHNLFSLLECPVNYLPDMKNLWISPAASLEPMLEVTR